MSEEIGGVANDSAIDSESWIKYGFKTHDWGGEAQQIEISEMITLLILIFSTSMCIAYTVNHAFRISIIPEPAIILAIGIAAGGILSLVRGDISHNLLSFSPETFFIIFLPPIIFDSGYKVNFPFFFGNFGAIMTYAVLGTALSALIIGSILYSIRSVGFDTPLEFAECLTFGSLISATDPVSTLAVFTDLRVEPNIFNIIVGESVLNDAVGLVLFNTFSKFIGFTHGGASAAIAVIEFVFVFALSILLGATVACLSAFVFKLLNIRNNERVLELSLFFLLAYLPYMLAEGIGLSGILSVLIGGMVTKHYTHVNLSDERSREMATFISSLLAHLSEAFVFLNLGMSVFGLKESESYNSAFIALSIVACLVARLIQLIILTPLFNFFRKERLSMKYLVMIWVSGLRGAVAYACATIFSDQNGHKNVMLVTTMMIVLFTVFILGSLTMPLLTLLKIEHHVDEGSFRISEPPKVLRVLVCVDQRCLRPLLLKSPQPQVLDDNDIYREELLQEKEIRNQRISHFKDDPDGIEMVESTKHDPVDVHVSDEDEEVVLEFQR